jgi:hypothetical protein
MSNAADQDVLFEINLDFKMCVSDACAKYLSFLNLFLLYGFVFMHIQNHLDSMQVFYNCFH